jgi:hypothetical protein
MADGAIITKRGRIIRIPDASPNPRVKIKHVYPRRKRSSAVGDYSDLAVNKAYQEALEFGEVPVLTVEDVRKKAKRTPHLLTRAEEAVAAENNIAGYHTIGTMFDARKAANSHARGVCLVSKINEHLEPVPDSDRFSKNFRGRWRSSLIDYDAISSYGRRNPLRGAEVVGLDDNPFDNYSEDDEYENNVTFN